MKQQRHPTSSPPQTPSSGTAARRPEASNQSMQALLTGAFGPRAAGLPILQGQDARNRALGADAHTSTAGISMSSAVSTDPLDAWSMSIWGHEVAHALGGLGSSPGVDQPGSAAEAGADAAGEAFAAFAQSGGQVRSPALRPAPAGEAQIHRKKKSGTSSPTPKVSQETAVPKTWPEMLQALKDAKDDAARQTAATALTAWCRANLPDQKLVERYLAQPNLKAEEKTATIGRLMAALARNEFLLGTLHLGGVGKSWETEGKNDGPAVDYYLKTSKLDGQVTRDNAAWCTSFVGTQAARAGFDFNDKEGGAAGSRSIFWSGSRLYAWAQDGKNTAGKQLNPAGEQVDDSPGSALIKAADWAAYAKSLAAAKTPEDRQKARADFFKKHPTPQAGDILIVGKGNAFYGKGNSHTIMVERYDAASGILSAVEGNSQDSVKGRTIDLTDADEVGKIVFVARLGASLFDDPGNSRTTPAPTPTPPTSTAPTSTAPTSTAPTSTAPAATEPVTAEQVLAGVSSANSDLAGVAVAGKMVKGTDPSASVSTLYHGTATAKDEGTSTR